MIDLLIDTDTASDDAVALILALRSAGHRVRGITCVAGNVGLAQAARNACLVVEHCDADVPVFAGCDRPMLRAASDASWFHGRDGLSDVGFAPRAKTVELTHAVDALLALSRDHVGCTLVTLGPLTNVAVALMREPAFASRVGRCVVMGGNPCCVGNVTPAAEYNIWCDPEAAQVVLSSGMNVELVGWHLSRGSAVWDARDIDALLASGSPLARFAVDCNRTAMEGYRRQTGEVGISLPDPVAMAVALDPSIVTSASSYRVLVECGSELTRGMTVVDQLNVGRDARNAGPWERATEASVVWSIDVPAFKRTLATVLHRTAEKD
jgi:purine nucleosidase